MGKHQLRLLKFAIRYRGEWHGYGTDRATTRALRSLHGMGLVEISPDTRQFRLAEPTRAKED